MWIRACLEALGSCGPDEAAISRAELQHAIWRSLMLLETVLGSASAGAAGGAALQQMHELDSVSQQASVLLRSADDVLQLLMQSPGGAMHPASIQLSAADSTLQLRLLSLIGIALKSGDVIMEPAVMLKCVSRAAQRLCLASGSAAGQMGRGHSSQWQLPALAAASSRQQMPEAVAEAEVMLLQLYAEAQAAAQDALSEELAAELAKPMLQLLQMMPSELILSNEQLLLLALQHSSQHGQLLTELLSCWLDRWQPVARLQQYGSAEEGTGAGAEPGAAGTAAALSGSIGTAKLVPCSTLGPDLAWMAQHLSQHAGAVLAVLHMLQALQMQPESPTLAKALVLLITMMESAEVSRGC